MTQDTVANAAQEEDKTTVSEVEEIANEAAGEAASEAQAEQADAEQDIASRIAGLEEALAAAQAEALYAKADVQNVRRRAEKEVADAHAYAATKFARDILSVADNMARALDAIPDGAREDELWKALIAGLEATSREIATVFERHGITRVEALGQNLDPNLHQAMVEIPTKDAEPGTIVQEIQSGYTIKGRLLRPALVAVAKAP